jgi:hypothetical protein
MEAGGDQWTGFLSVGGDGICPPIIRLLVGEGRPGECPLLDVVLRGGEGRKRRITASIPKRRSYGVVVTHVTSNDEGYSRPLDITIKYKSG